MFFGGEEQGRVRSRDYGVKFTNQVIHKSLPKGSRARGFTCHAGNNI